MSCREIEQVTSGYMTAKAAEALLELKAVAALEVNE